MDCDDYKKFIESIADSWRIFLGLLEKDTSRDDLIKYVKILIAGLEKESKLYD